LKIKESYDYWTDLFTRETGYHGTLESHLEKIKVFDKSDVGLVREYRYENQEIKVMDNVKKLNEVSDALRKELGEATSVQAILVLDFIKDVNELSIRMKNYYKAKQDDKKGL
jgi:hypothetical protein